MWQPQQWRATRAGTVSQRRAVAGVHGAMGGMTVRHLDAAEATGAAGLASVIILTVSTVPEGSKR